MEAASLGRWGSSGNRLCAAQIEQIRRTVRRTPELMVKVTGGGTKIGAVVAHFAYISRKGKLEIESDEGGANCRERRATSLSRRLAS